ncbi:MAG TPA: hypothetical protein EYG85_02260 [Crocinitomix sp.]|nr:hypothetical protein [Crocinitomix sp.]
MRLVIYIGLILGLHSCFSYSFIDGSIDAESFSVSIFEEQAANAPAGYGGQFTDYLKNFIIGRSKLKLKDIDADIQISGKIVGYNTAPLAVQSDEAAALSRLTVTMFVSVVNNVKPEQSFEQNFSQFSDFDSNNDLSTVETQLIEDVNNKIAQDIVNKLSSNW